MASIGLGLATGRALWEAGRRENEENERFLMGRKQFEQELKLAELQTEAQIIEQEEVTSALNTLAPYQRAIRSGDIEAMAQFLTDMSPDDNAVYTVEGNEIVKYRQDEDGRLNFDSTVVDTTGYSGPELLSEAYRYAQSSSSLVSEVRTAQAANAEFLNSMQLEQFKSDLRMDQIRLEGSIQAGLANAKAAKTGLSDVDFIDTGMQVAFGMGLQFIEREDGSYTLLQMDGVTPATPEQQAQWQAEVQRVNSAVASTGESPGTIMTSFNNDRAKAARDAELAASIVPGSPTLPAPEHVSDGVVPVELGVVVGNKATPYEEQTYIPAYDGYDLANAPGAARVAVQNTLGNLWNKIQDPSATWGGMSVPTTDQPYVVPDNGSGLWSQANGQNKFIPQLMDTITFDRQNLNSPSIVLTPRF